MAKEHYYTDHTRPNIIIIPTTSICHPPSPKKPKLEQPLANQSPQYEDLSFLDDFNIDEIVACLNNCDSKSVQENNDKADINETSQITIKQNLTMTSNGNIEQKNDKNVDKVKTLLISKRFNENVEGRNEINIDHVEILQISKEQDMIISPNGNIKEANNNNIDNVGTLQISKEKDVIITFNCNKEERSDKNIDYILHVNDLVQKNICDDKNKRDTVNIKSKEDSKYSYVSIQKFKDVIQNKEVASVKIHSEISENNNNNYKLEKNHSEKNVQTKENNNKIIIEDSNDTKTCPLLENKDKVLIKERKISKPNKNTEIFTKEKFKCKDIGQTENKKSNISKKSTATPKSIICSNSDVILSKNLENIMFEYLKTKYTVKSIVNYGKFSKIFKCLDSVNKPYAVKMLNCKLSKDCSNRQDKIFTDIQADIPKENLFSVHVLNSFSMKGQWCFLMEFHPKNLKQALDESEKPFHIDMVQDLARQLVAAVTILRTNNIIHSDIKPSHILLNSSNTRLTLCGFDRSYYSQDIIISPYIGSPNYRPPEVILGYSAGYSIDVWATALVLHEMATGKKMFPAFYNRDILYSQICALGNIPYEMVEGSRYKDDYFVGELFKKRFGYKGLKTVLVGVFYENNQLRKTINKAYFESWSSTRTKEQISKDLRKIDSFLKLLEKMLVICPNYRIPIEFVYADPFVYEVFDC